MDPMINRPNASLRRENMMVPVVPQTLAPGQDGLHALPQWSCRKLKIVNDPLKVFFSLGHRSSE